METEQRAEDAAKRVAQLWRGERYDVISDKAELMREIRLVWPEFFAMLDELQRVWPE